MMTETLYCIMWEVKHTGVRGRGDAIMTRDDAEALVRIANESQAGKWVRHWAEPMPDKVPK